MVRKNCFGLVAQAQEELDVPWCAEHGAGVQLVGIGRRLFDFVDEGFPHSLPLMGGHHGQQPDHTHAGHRPEAHGTDDHGSIFRYKNMFLSRVTLQALERFRRPAAHGVDRGIFAERGLLHMEDRREICFGCWSNVHYGLASG